MFGTPTLIPLDNISPEQFLAIAHAAAEELKWTIRYISPSSLIIDTDTTFSGILGTEITFKIDGDNAHIKAVSSVIGKFNWLEGRKEIKKYIAAFNHQKELLTETDRISRYAHLKESGLIDEGDALNKPKLSTKEKLAEAASVFVPRSDYVITPLLLYVNIGVFILMAASGVSIIDPDTDTLISWGGNFRPLTINGEWWRLLSSCFVHIGIIHLLLNMWALAYIGNLLEPMLRPVRFLIAYLACGIVAAATSLWWHELTVSAGASGAIFGMYGVFFVLLTANFIEKEIRSSLLSSVVPFVAYNLINGMKEGIDNAAHVGGLVAGLLIGYMYVPVLKGTDSPVKKNVGTFAPVLVTLLAIFSLAFMPASDVGSFQQKMKEFEVNESKALEIYDYPNDTPVDTLLHAISQKGIVYWEKNVQLMKEVEKLKLPEHLRKRSQLLMEYSSLRLESNKLTYKAMEENTDKYDAEIKSVVAKCNNIIDQIKNGSE